MPNTSHTRPAVSVVIPTYNGRHLLEKQLPSVFAATTSADQVVIIDDASSDDTFKWLESKFGLQPLAHLPASLLSADTAASYWQSSLKPTLLVIVNAHNLRFAASVNRAVRAAKHPFVFLINNDVIPDPQVLSPLCRHFADPQMFAVGCRETESHNHNQLAGKNHVWFEKGMFMHRKASDFTTGETGWASGGSALFDRSKWLELGGFDAAYYPAYWEDIDLSMRAKRRGWLVWFEAEAQVVHDHESTNADVFGQRKIARMSWRNARIFAWRHAQGLEKLQFLMWLPYHLFRQWRSGQL